MISAINANKPREVFNSTVVYPITFASTSKGVKFVEYYLLPAIFSKHCFWHILKYVYGQFGGYFEA